MITYFLPNNELVFLQLRNSEAVSWKNVPVVNGVPHSWYAMSFQGHVVDSGSTCILNAGDEPLLMHALKENEWLTYVDFLEYGNAFFYIDLSDEVFHELTTQLLGFERELRRVSGWAQTLTGKTAGQEMAGLYRKHKSFTEYLNEFRIANPENDDLVDDLLKGRAEIIGRLTEWTEQKAFSERMASTREMWDESYLQMRQDTFRIVKHIVFDNENRSSAFLFQTGDDVYPAFVGYDSNGEICNLIMDYGGVGLPDQIDNDNEAKKDHSESSHLGDI